MRLTFVPKEPDKAYIADRLWLPKNRVNIDVLKTALEFTVSSNKGQTKMSLWEESRHHLICPREYLPASYYPNFNFPFIDLRPAFEEVNFRDLVVPRNADQEKAWAAFSVNNNGILNLGCGKGKTRLALKKIAQRRMPALVIVPDGGILSQWVESIYGNPEKGIPAGLGFDGELGMIEGGKFDWRHPVTLALVTSLWPKIEKGTVPEELYRYFGLVVYDEVHQIGAPKFSLTASPFYGDRIGLTATVKREDGLDPIYRFHLGEPFYCDLTQDLIPRIYFQQTPVVLNYEAARSESTGMINTSMLRVMLGRDLVGNTYRYWSIKEALDQGRKILCLSHSKDQLKLFHAMFPGSALLVGDTKRDTRMELLRQSRICFAIERLAKTGVDDDRLDTEFWLSPFRSRIALQQSMGRIQRSRPGKLQPVMVVFEDWLTPTLKKLCSALKGILREQHFKVEVLKPRRALPQELPSDVRAAYDEAFAALPERGELEPEE